MVVIRLSRAGTKKKPFYHLSVADKRSPRDGRFIERVGFYNPVARGKSEPLRVDLERVDYWLSVGAQLSPKVKSIVARARILDALPPEPVVPEPIDSSSANDRESQQTATEESEETSVETEESEVATVSSNTEETDEVVTEVSEQSDSLDASSDEQTSEENAGSEEDAKETISVEGAADVEIGAERTEEGESDVENIPVDEAAKSDDDKSS